MEDKIKIRIVQLGKQVIDFEGKPDCTVEDVLRETGVYADYLRTDIRVDGEPAERSTVLKNGDIMTVLPPIKGG